MRAFHSTWTGPFFMSHTGEFYIEDFELLTTILSALKWRELNGDIKMITDKVGAAYYKQLGLEGVWNLGIDDSLGENIDQTLKPDVFWAAGKIYALAKEEAPCVMIDTDFIVWEDIRSKLAGPITVIHRENIEPSVYPAAEALQVESRYMRFLEEWDWQARPCNTAFLFIEEAPFKTFYVEEAKRFMKVAEGDNPLTYMVFAEQRLLAMCAAKKQKEIYAFAEVEDLFDREQTTFTHIWGHKRYLRENIMERTKFCKRCMKRIKEDYSDFYPILLNIPILCQYDEGEWNRSSECG